MFLNKLGVTACFCKHLFSPLCLSASEIKCYAEDSVFVVFSSRLSASSCTDRGLLKSQLLLFSENLNAWSTYDLPHKYTMNVSFVFFPAATQEIIDSNSKHLKQELCETQLHQNIAAYPLDLLLIIYYVFLNSFGIHYQYMKPK